MRDSVATGQAIRPHATMRSRASVGVGMYHSPPAYYVAALRTAWHATAGCPALVIELSNNAMQLTKGGWMRVRASSSATRPS